MLTVSTVTKAFGGRVLFEEASLQVNRGDRMGLVGPNGAGKSTLFSLIRGDATPDAGTIATQKNATIGHLRQESADVGGESVLDIALNISPEMAGLRGIIHAHESGGSHAPDDDTYHEALARFDELGGWQLEPKAKRILRGLAFRERDFDKPAAELSGGWIMRAHLARLLVQEPDLLMLDEPTNHLDLESVVWFQGYLEQYPGAILLISHDREFLNALVTQILEIRHARLIRYTGNYDSYLTQRAARDVQHRAAYENQQREIDRLQRFADRFRAKASKASQAQSKLKQIDRMEKIDAPIEAGRKIRFQFPQPARSGQRAITLAGVRQAYGDHVVYSDLNLEVERGQRTVLVGPNGAGKSTLLKILAGVIPVQAGTRAPGHNVACGYFAQHRTEMLHSSRTVLEEAQELKNRPPEQVVRTVLGAFLFSGDDVFKPVAVLSGGEKSRLALARLLLDPPNLLLMDEPTTHLDMDSIDALIGALRQYEGTLFFISHDVYFIRQIATSVLHVRDGTLTPYPGDYQYYLDKSRALSEKDALTATGNGPDGSAAATPAAAPAGAPAPAARKSREQKRLEADARRTRSGARKQKAQKVAGLEAEISRFETRQTTISAELEASETYADPGAAIALNRELIGIAEALGNLNERWEIAAAELAAFDSQAG